MVEKTDKKSIKPPTYDQKVKELQKENEHLRRKQLDALIEHKSICSQLIEKQNELEELRLAYDELCKQKVQVTSNDCQSSLNSTAKSENYRIGDSTNQEVLSDLKSI